MATWTAREETNLSIILKKKIYKISGLENFDPTIATHLNQVLVAADNDTRVARKGASQKLIVVGIVTHLFRQFRRLNKICFPGHKAKDRGQIYIRKLGGQNITHSTVFGQDFIRNYQLKPAIAPGF